MKTQILLTATLMGVMSLYACRDDFSINELENFSDSLPINGVIAGPFINSDFAFTKIKPSTFGDNVSFFVDDNKLIHLRSNDNFDYSYYDITNKSYKTGVEEPECYFSLLTSKSILMGDDFTGSFSVKNPEWVLYIIGQSKAKIGITITNITFFDENDNKIDSISNTEINNIELISEYKKGESINSSLTINNSNTNNKLSKIFALNPRKFNLEIKLHIFAQTMQEDIDNNEPIDFRISSDLPLEMKVKNVMVKDSMDLDLNSNFFNYTDTLEIKAASENQWPANVSLIMYFANTDTGIIGEYIFDNESFISKSGTENNPSNNEARKIFTREDINKMQDIGCDQIIYKLVLNTDNYDADQYHDFYDTQKLKLRVSFKAIIKEENTK